ncbi:MAG: hypothetical protein QXD59_06165 [Candidatus Caldarchaeum sp.]
MTKVYPSLRIRLIDGDHDQGLLLRHRGTDDMQGPSLSRAAIDQATRIGPIPRILLDNLAVAERLAYLSGMDHAELLVQHLVEGMAAELETFEAPSDHLNIHRLLV